MSRTFIRQDDQIAASNTSDGGYGDAVAPTLANYQTNPNTILDDLNNLRSVAHYLKNVQTSNWYTAQTAPSALEAGILRGVDNLNDALHLVEKKRILRDVYNLVDVVVPSGVQATGTYTSTGAFSDGETVTIGTQTYTFKSPFVDAANNIDASGTTAQTHENLRRAINGDGVAGTNYGTGTPVNTNVTATDTATTNVLTAILAGTVGNLVATTTTAANASFGATTLTGGAGDVSILTAPQLPSQTTAAVGAVTTLGTVLADNSADFGNISLVEVTGVNAINPKNLMVIVDGATRAPIQSSGRDIFGLFQSENATNGYTITATTPDRVQISYVRLTAAGDDIEYCPAADIAGKTINYAYRERVRLEDLTEEDFLRGAVIDIPGATTVTRQFAYDNQGTTPVEQATNATLDLNSAGIYWEIRDLVNATLFRITEGSGGGTTTLQIATDVDTFDVNAIVNDFNAGISARTGGTRPIDIGVTDGVVETTAGDLKLVGFAQLAFSDQWQGASTYTSDLVLSDTSAEWSAYETAFGGEVSLLNAIVQAANTNLHAKVWAIATANVAANNDVSGPSNDNNLDTDLGDLSGGDFLQDYDLYLNGVLLRPGANAGANHDYYPGTSLANGQIKFEFNIKGTGSKPDQFTLVKWV